jgi:hypothetical protein
MLIDKHSLHKFLDRPMQSFAWIKDINRDELIESIAYATRHGEPFEFKTEPWLHQLACMYVGICLRRWLFTVDMGGGKTKLLLDLISFFMQEEGLGQSLVLVPRRINAGDWLDAVPVHSDLSASAVLQTNIERKWEVLADASTDIVLCDYPSIELCIYSGKGRSLNTKRLKHLESKYKFVGCDEMQHVSRAGTHRFHILDRLSQSATHFFGITGTPMNRDPEKLWVVGKLVDRGYTFGETLGLYRAAFYDSKPSYFTGRPEYKFDKQHAPELNRRLQNFSLRYEDVEFSDLPPVLERVVNVDMTDEQRDAYSTVTRGVIIEGQRFPTDAAFYRMRMVTAGVVDFEDDVGTRRKVRLDDNPKLDALMEYIEELPDDRKLLVYHEYTESGRLICEALEHMKIGHAWIYGDTRDPIAMKKRFIETKRCRVLVLNSLSGAEGLDGLQNVCHHLARFESNSRPDINKQQVKRLQRHGQQHTVFVTNFACRSSVDSRLLESIEAGHDLMSRVVDGRSFKALLGNTV